MHVTVIPGVGPATAERLRRAGIHTVADLEGVSEDELVRLLGRAHGHGLYLLARAEDDRPVVSEREAKSVSVEGTYDTDLTDRRLMEGLLSRQAGNVAERLRKQRAVRPHGDHQGAAPRLHHPEPLDHPALPHRRRADDRPAGPRPAGRPRHLPAAYACSASVSRASPTGSRRTSSARDDEPEEDEEPIEALPDLPDAAPGCPGMDVVHERASAAGWVWGSGRGVVTVRFETAETAARAGALASRRRPRRSARGGPAAETAPRSPGRSCAHCHRSASSTTPTTG